VLHLFWLGDVSYNTTDESLSFGRRRWQEKKQEAKREREKAMKGIVIEALLLACLCVPRPAHAQMIVQPGVPGGLVIAAPLAGGGAMVVQPGMNTPPTLIVPFAGNEGAMIVQPGGRA
jgi:hypothetical protein